MNEHRTILKQGHRRRHAGVVFGALSLGREQVPLIQNSPRHRSRRGVTIIIVIALFAVAITMIGVWTRSALGHRRQMRRWHQRMQTTWLADAGLRRAAARLARDGANYTGERWQIAAESLSSNANAEVVIRIEPIDDPAKESTDRVRIIAVADYFSGGQGPAEDRRLVRITKSSEINLNNSGAEP